MSSVQSDYKNILLRNTGKLVYIKAPAKLNLRLKVKGRREDGYHLLSMINALTELSDDISLTLSEEKTYQVVSIKGNRMTVESFGSGGKRVDKWTKN